MLDHRLQILLDDEVYGSHTVNKRDLFLGNRFEGSGIFDITLQGTWSTAKTRFTDVNSGSVFSEPDQAFGGIRINTTPQIRIVNPDALPGIKWGIDSLMVVFPAHWDKVIEGRRDYENIRIGPEIWGRIFSPAAGSAFLVTLDYNYQYFYNINDGKNPKGLHLFMANLRLGWGDL